MKEELDFPALNHFSVQSKWADNLEDGGKENKESKRRRNIFTEPLPSAGLCIGVFPVLPQAREAVLASLFNADSVTRIT